MHHDLRKLPCSHSLLVNSSPGGSCRPTNPRFAAYNQHELTQLTETVMTPRYSSISNTSPSPPAALTSLGRLRQIPIISTPLPTHPVTLALEVTLFPPTSSHDIENGTVVILAAISTQSHTHVPPSSSRPPSPLSPAMVSKHDPHIQSHRYAHRA